MLGWQEPRYRQPPGPHVCHDQGGLRTRWRVPGIAPRPDGPSCVRITPPSIASLVLHSDEPCSYETLWDTTAFNSLWPANGANPFQLSFGDAKGYGTHADYLFGWKGDSLQRAMDHSCMFQACENGKPLKSQGVQPMNACQVKDLVGEPNGDQCELSYILNLQGLSDATCVLGLSKLPGATV